MFMGENLLCDYLGNSKKELFKNGQKDRHSTVSMMNAGWAIHSILGAEQSSLTEDG